MFAMIIRVNLGNMFGNFAKRQSKSPFQIAFEKVGCYIGTAWRGSPSQPKTIQKENTMKRKWLVMLLCVALCLAMAFSFAACGDDEDKGKDNGKDNGNTTTEKVTVTFKNGETVVDTIEITKGTAVAATTKTVEAPEGKQFKSWQKDGKDYDFATKVNENITLTATFEDITYTISFKKKLRIRTLSLD